MSDQGRSEGSAHSPSAWQFSVMETLGRMVGELQSLRQDMHQHLNHLPERMATQMVLHMNRSCREAVASAGKPTAMQQLTALLGTVLPYAVLAWRATFLMALWSLLAKGVYSSREIGEILAEGVKHLWGG